MQARLLDLMMVALAAMLGLAFCWFWAGPIILDPANSGWLQRGDPAMHTLGWWYFLAAPWGMPPGANPLLGLELSSSVALSDSLPLFAIPFTLFADYLPERFQYWGIWFALSFALQAVFGYLIAHELNLSRAIALLAALFCVIQPAFLYRIGTHMALGGHWTVLAALYLYLRRTPPQPWAWPLLLGMVSAIHGYLLAMCFGLWLAALVQRWWLKRTSRALLVLEVALAAAGTFGVLWATGTLMVSSLGSGGYGVYRMNLLSLIDASGWSRFWPDIPQRSADYEGFNFPGVGIIALIVLVLALGPRPRWRAFIEPHWLPLTVICACLTLFAISNHIGIANFGLPAIPIPEPLGRFAQIFRSSGRMFWPVGYLILFVAVLFAARRLGRWTVPVLAVLVAVQAIDSQPKWSEFRAREAMGASWTDTLDDPAWAVLGENYARVRSAPTDPLHPKWMELSYFALQHYIGTDIAYLGRVDAEAFDARAEQMDSELVSGEFEPDTLYILDFFAALRVLDHLQPGDLFTQLNGLTVFARGGGALLAEHGIAVTPYVPERNVLPAEERLSITRQVQADYLLEGWSGREAWGVWTEGKRAVIEFKTAIEGQSYLQFRAYGSLRNLFVPQQVTVLVNGAVVAELELTKERRVYAVPLGSHARGDDISVEFRIADPFAPIELYGTGDNRKLGMGVYWFEHKAGEPPVGAGGS
ncbi:MAG: DUF6311 domain-containing protein [Devosia sp.]